MRCRVERGAATVVTVAAVGVVLVVLAAALVLAGTVRDVHRARAAADLAALAAAVPLADGLAADCSAARSVAVANGATRRQWGWSGRRIARWPGFIVQIEPGRAGGGRSRSRKKSRFFFSRE